MSVLTKARTLEVLHDLAKEYAGKQARDSIARNDHMHRLPKDTPITDDEIFQVMDNLMDVVDDEWDSSIHRDPPLVGDILRFFIRIAEEKRWVIDTNEKEFAIVTMYCNAVGARFGCDLGLYTRDLD